MSSNEIVVTYGEGMRVNASFGDFFIETDQHPKYGGEGSAPEPYDLFLASLVACAGVFVRGFCKKRDIPADDIRLVQKTERDDKGKIVKLSIDIEVPESFPAEYLGALPRVAAKCAVKKTVLDPPEFVSQTVVVEA